MGWNSNSFAKSILLESSLAKPLSLHHDISTLTGEEVVLFTLAKSPRAKQRIDRAPASSTHHAERDPTSLYVREPEHSNPNCGRGRERPCGRSPAQIRLD